MAGWTGSVFVFWDIHATSLRCACANSKLSFDVMSRPRPPRRSRDASYRLRWADSSRVRKEFGRRSRCTAHDAGREESRRARGGWIRGSRAVGAVLPDARGGGGGPPPRAPETGIRPEGFVSVARTHARPG